MRILHVTKKYPNALGGDAIVSFNLEKQQKKLGYEAFILTTNCDEIIDKLNVIKFGLKRSYSKLGHCNFQKAFLIINIILFII